MAVRGSVGIFNHTILTSLQLNHSSGTIYLKHLETPGPQYFFCVFPGQHEFPVVQCHWRTQCLHFSPLGSLYFTTSLFSFPFRNEYTPLLSARRRTFLLKHRCVVRALSTDGDIRLSGRSQMLNCIRP